jgi:hypothetical protein
MVAVEHHLAVRHIGDGVETGVLFHFHAGGDAFAVALGGLDAQEIGVVLAERVFGLELQLDRLAGCLALQGALEGGEELAVAAVQVGEVRGNLQLYALCIVQLDAQGNHGVLGYERSRLTRSNTSMACPRGLTP